MKVKIKLTHLDAAIPRYSTSGSAGLDVKCVKITYESRYIVYHTGLAVEVPVGHIGLLNPRSSISNYDVILANGQGWIDSDYRGEITLRMKLFSQNGRTPIELYKVGDNIGQLLIIPYPKIEFEQVDELSETDRGIGGYGSTGK